MSLPAPLLFPGFSVSSGLAVGSVAAPAPLVDLPVRPAGRTGSSHVECGDDPDEDEDDLGEDDLPEAQPAPEDESSFDDFDDDFDDDFEEEENDPDWDHPDDAEPEPPPPGKGGSRKK
ncbi:MAG: hypothetical protein ACKOTB_17955 [Planctomycetia bacterium]